MCVCVRVCVRARARRTPKVKFPPKIHDFKPKSL